MLYPLFKQLYFLIPYKKYFFLIIRQFYTPSSKIAGFLKFKGNFNLLEPNIRLKLYNNNSTISSLIFWKGIKGYEEHSTNIWAHLSKKSSVIFDVGANFGLFGLISKSINKNSQITFFEPIKRNVELIKKNVSINSFNANIEEIAVSNSNGEAIFYDMAEEENTIGSFDPDFIRGHKHSKELIPTNVKVKMLDSFFEDSNLDALDLVKIDVEGHEYETIQGFTKTIKKHIPNILIEITNNETAKKLMELFIEEKIEYHYFAIDNVAGLIRKDRITKSDTVGNYLLCNNDTLAEITNLSSKFNK